MCPILVAINGKQEGHVMNFLRSGIVRATAGVLLPPRGARAASTLTSVVMAVLLVATAIGTALIWTGPGLHPSGN